jgi:hypothetical protein
MKRIFGAGMALVLLLVATSFAKTTTYERITVIIPFDFSVHQRVFAAGIYVVTQVRDEPDAPGVNPNDGLYEIQSEDRHGPMASMQTTSLSAHHQINEHTKLVFNKYGNQYFLSQIWASGQPQGRAVLKSRKEREIMKKGGWQSGEGVEEVTVAALD